jgi:hypothetical protein
MWKLVQRQIIRYTHIMKLYLSHKFSQKQKWFNKLNSLYIYMLNSTVSGQLQSQHKYKQQQ